MDFEFMASAFPEILKAVPVTLEMLFISAGIGWALGLVIALCRLSKVPVLSQFLAVFVSCMRSVPSVILLYISYYVMPTIIGDYGESIGVTIDINLIPAIVYAILALTMNQAAYSSEVFRASIAAIDEGQREAALSIGMTKTQALFRIILPQAFSSAMPNMSGLFIGLLKDTSLSYYVGVYEITATANLLSLPKLNFIEAYIMTTVIYEVLSVIFNKCFKIGEKKVSIYKMNPTQISKGKEDRQAVKGLQTSRISKISA